MIRLRIAAADRGWLAPVPKKVVLYWLPWDELS